MGNNLQETDQKVGVVKIKHGVPVYRTNPSVPEAETIKKQKRVRIGNDKKGFVIDNYSGEILAVGGVGFYEFEEVDNTRFVKLFLEGIKQTAGLSKAGLAVFELVYRQIQNNPGSDQIGLNIDMLVDLGGKKMTKTTYFRGLRELLEREFLFKSLIDGVFFINIRYMFNGDRLAFVKGYKRKNSNNQDTLPSEGGDL